jgi:hypothetical protein
MKFLMFFIMFLLIGAFYIISEENLNLGVSEERLKFFSLYGEWFDKLGSNTGVVSGYVLKMQWLPE